MMNYEESSEFSRELKKLLKKYSSLEEDIKTAKKNAIELFHIQGMNNASVYPVPGYCSDLLQIFKIKKFACKALKGKGCRSGIRVIYAFFPEEMRVEFLEIYYKEKNSTDMNHARTKAYISNFQ